MKLLISLGFLLTFALVVTLGKVTKHCKFSVRQKQFYEPSETEFIVFFQADEQLQRDDLVQKIQGLGLSDGLMGALKKSPATFPKPKSLAVLKALIKSFGGTKDDCDKADQIAKLLSISAK